MIEPLPSKVGTGETTEFAVDGVNQATARCFLTVAPGDQQPGDVER